MDTCSPNSRASGLLYIAVLLAVAAPLPGALSAQDESAPRAPAVAPNAGTLLQQLEAANPDDVGRDSAGNVVSVALRQGWARHHNLTLLCTVDILRRIVLVPSCQAQPSEHGLASLAQ